MVIVTWCISINAQNNKPVKYELNWSSKLHKVVCFEVSKFKYLMQNYFFLEKLCYFRESCFSQCFIFPQQLSIACRQVCFYASIAIILSNYQKCPVPLKDCLVGLCYPFYPMFKENSISI